jgi:hypothetical protein
MVSTNLLKTQKFNPVKQSQIQKQYPLMAYNKHEPQNSRSLERKKRKFNKVQTTFELLCWLFGFSVSKI